MTGRHPSTVALRHFKAFAGTIASGGVTAASDRLRRSPSSVSRSVAILEAVFAVPLLNRVSGRLTATSVGELVVLRCDAIRAELDRCRTLLLRDHRAAVRANAALFEMQTDLNHLRALVAVHDFRSVQRAADLLKVSQPAVSYSIRLLEADVGAELFSRMRIGMIPTPAGMTLTICARRVLAEISKLSDDVHTAEGLSTGMVRIGGLPYSRGVILPEAIRRVLSHHPGVSIRTVEGPIENLMTALHGDEVDAVICAYPDRAFLEGITVEPIAEDALGFFVAHDHPLAGRRDLSLADILACPLVLPPSGSITRRLLEDFCLKTAGIVPHGRAETSSSSLIRNLLLDSDFVAFRSTQEFLTHNSDGQIIPLDIALPLPTRTICVLRRQGVRPTAAIREFLSAVRTVGSAPSRAGAT